MSILSGTIITLNEEKNLQSWLESVTFADEIIVVDSGNKDSTLDIAQVMAPEEALLDQFFIKKQPPAGWRVQDGRTSSFSWKNTPIIQPQTNPFGFKLLGPITLSPFITEGASVD